MKKIAKFIPVVVAAVPVLVFAAVTPESSILSTFILTLSSIISGVVPLLMGVVGIFFLYNLIQFIISAGDEGKRENARMMMIYSVIGMFVMATIWGLVEALKDFLGIGIGGGTSSDLPTLFNGFN